MLTRREMLQTSLVMGSAAMFGSQLLAAEKAKPETGVQLYSIRSMCKKETLPEIFKALKDMGYAGVEFAGYYGCSAEELKKFLADAGLKPCGTHTGYGTIKPDQIEQTIEFNQGYGNKYLVVPGGVPGNDEDTWKQHAEVFSKAAEVAKKAGMYVGYHNHQHEFKKFPNGKCAWEVLFENASPDV
ncbi:MAG: sugar phosphate isomerase/epimerase, partial [Planctomycetaceae bacterium]|nr:sugar phosphate isomerase/epimerase [Planctomycetaceae bacterium]